MQTMTSDELCSMEIINLCGGTCLGTPESLELRCGCEQQLCQLCDLCLYLSHQTPSSRSFCSSFSQSS